MIEMGIQNDVLTPDWLIFKKAALWLAKSVTKLVSIWKPVWTNKVNPK